MSYFLSLLFNEATLNDSGAPANGWKLETYLAGTTTAATVYKDSGGAASHTNPIVLNARGEPPAPIWILGGQQIKFVLTDSSGTVKRTIDGVPGANDAEDITPDEWQPFTAAAPVYVNATSFTLSGDRTATFTVERRLKTTITAGTGYHSITASSYSSPNTTVTVNGTSLDSGLSAVSYSLLSSSNSSIPGVLLSSGAWSFEKTATFQDPTTASKKVDIIASGVPASTTRHLYGAQPIRAVTSADTFIESDFGKLVTITGDTTMGTTAAATLGSGWWCDFLNIGTGTLTIDPNSSETISIPGGPQTPGTSGTFPYSGTGPGNYNMSGGRLICDGSGFRVINPIENHGSHTITATGAYSWTPPAGVKTIWIDAAAGGGGGGATNTGANAGGGGGGGESFDSYQATVTPGTAVTGSVGTAGTAGVSSGANGGNGGDTTIVVPAGTLTLHGGVGGTNDGSGGAGGSGTSGAVAGGNGGAGSSGGGTLTTAGGGGSMWGSGGPGSMATAVNGSGFGGGGSGRAASAGAGGAGTQGFVRIRW